MIYLKLFLVLSILYLFFCLFLLSYSKYKRDKNPILFIDTIKDNIEEHFNKNEAIRKKEEEEKEIEDNYISMS